MAAVHGVVVCRQNKAACGWIFTAEVICHRRPWLPRRSPINGCHCHRLSTVVPSSPLFFFLFMVFVSTVVAAVMPWVPWIYMWLPTSCRAWMGVMEPHTSAAEISSCHA
jgi:hypothetical protein